MKSTSRKASHSHGHKFLLGFSILLLLCGLPPEGSASGSGTKLVTPDLAALAEDRASQPSKSFTCLPKDVQPGEVVSYRPNGTRNVTVEKKLVELKARCRDGKLVDAKRREIRFFHPSCWGNPPPDYLEVRERENEELAKLRKRYIVVVFACNPFIQ